MSHEHNMHLDPQPFEAIAFGRKTVELRVNDDKRRKVKVDDIILFVMRGNEALTMLVKVTDLQHAPSFDALIKLYPPARLGVDAVGAGALVLRLNRAYGEAEQKQFGCVGLGFRLLRAI